MDACPNCRSHLTECHSEFGMMFLCGACKGRAISMPVLRRQCGAKAAGQLWQQARQAPRTGRPCPHCQQNMNLLYVPHPDGKEPVILECCPRCQVLWFDDKELDALPAAGPQQAAGGGELSEKARQAIALFDAERAAAPAEESAFDLGPGGAPLWARALLGALGTILRGRI